MWAEDRVLGLISSEIHSRLQKCRRRPVQSSRPGDRIRVVPSPGGLRQHKKEVASSSRPVRHIPEFQMSELFCSYQISPESRNRCLPPELGGYAGIFIPPIQPNQEGPKQGQNVSISSDDINRSLLASEGVVPGPVGGAHGTTSSVANEERSFNTTTFSSFSPTTLVAST